MASLMCCIVQCFAAMDKRMDTFCKQALERFHHFLIVVSFLQSLASAWQASFRQHKEIDSLTEVSVMEKFNSSLMIWYKIPHIIFFFFSTYTNSRYHFSLLLLGLCYKASVCVVLGLHPYACVHIVCKIVAYGG